MGYIYKITNNITKKIYIGKTIQPLVETRWKQHKNLSYKNKGCTALKGAFSKYGIDNFTFTIIIICFNEDCNIYEKEYIHKYNSLVPNGYNISEGGNGGPLFKGKHHSIETKNKLSETTRTFYSTLTDIDKDIFRKKIKEGLENSEKWKTAVKENKISKNRKTPYTRGELLDITKEKISKSVKEYFNILDNENKNINILKHRNIMSEKVGIKICQYDHNNIYINSYLSIAEAVRKTGAKKTSIQMCIKGKLKTAGGFLWKKSDD